jgi:glycerophosphoryl diester phosphodiesterase
MAVLPGSSEPAPLVFAHRGSSAALPEHTLDAYLRAIDEGADGLECDVRLTRDGHLVCIHDRRLDRTSNGRGRVSAATLAELDRLDFASWHPETTVIAGGVLTLDRLISVAREAGRPLRLLIETKHPNRYGAAVEDALVALLRRRGLSGDAMGSVSVSVMSFNPLALRRIRQFAPGVPTVFLFEVVTPGVRDGRPPWHTGILGPGIKALRARPELVRRAHERGHQVYLWTVNTREETDLALALGVDGIISDRPAYILERLGR